MKIHFGFLFTVFNTMLGTGKMTYKIAPDFFKMNRLTISLDKVCNQTSLFTSRISIKMQ